MLNSNTYPWNQSIHTCDTAHLEDEAGETKASGTLPIQQNCGLVGRISDIAYSPCGGGVVPESLIDIGSHQEMALHSNSSLPEPLWFFAPRAHTCV